MKSPYAAGIILGVEEKAPAEGTYTFTFPNLQFQDFKGKSCTPLKWTNIIFLRVTIGIDT